MKKDYTSGFDYGKKVLQEIKSKGRGQDGSWWDMADKRREQARDTCIEYATNLDVKYTKKGKLLTDDMRKYYKGMAVALTANELKREKTFYKAKNRDEWIQKTYDERDKRKEQRADLAQYVSRDDEGLKAYYRKSNEPEYKILRLRRRVENIDREVKELDSVIYGKGVDRYSRRYANQRKIELLRLKKQLNEERKALIEECEDERENEGYNLGYDHLTVELDPRYLEEYRKKNEAE